MPTPLDEAKSNGFPGNHVRSWHEADHLRLSPSRQPLTQSEHSMQSDDRISSVSAYS